MTSENYRYVKEQLGKLETPQAGVDFSTQVDRIPTQYKLHDAKTVSKKPCANRNSISIL